MSSVKLSSKHQIVIPREAREKLGLRPGDLAEPGARRVGPRDPSGRGRGAKRASRPSRGYSLQPRAQDHGREHQPVCNQHPDTRDDRLNVAFQPLGWDWTPVIWALASLLTAIVMRVVLPTLLDSDPTLQRSIRLRNLQCLSRPAPAPPARLRVFVSRLPASCSVLFPPALHPISPPAHNGASPHFFRTKAASMTDVTGTAKRIIASIDEPESIYVRADKTGAATALVRVMR